MALKVVQSNFKNGSEEPKQTSNLRLFGYQFCPYVERTYLVIAAKGLESEVEMVNIDINEKPEWFLKKNKLGKVPILELKDGKILKESTLICDYLNEAFSGATDLNPEDVFEKYKQRAFLEAMSPLFTAFYKIYRSKEDLKTLFGTIADALVLFEDELEERGTKFLGSDKEPKMVDYLIYPWIERLPSAFTLIHGEKDWRKYFALKFPHLLNYMTCMRVNEAVRRVAYSDEIHADYLRYHIKLIRNEDI